MKIEGTAAPAYPLHHLCDCQVDVVLNSMAILVGVCAPIETNLRASVVKHNCEVELVLPEEHVEDSSRRGTIALGDSIDRKISVGVNGIGIGVSLVSDEA